MKVKGGKERKCEGDRERRKKGEEKRERKIGGEGRKGGEEVKGVLDIATNRQW